MTIVNIHEAKTHFFKLLQRVMSGEEIIIARAGSRWRCFGR
ncbi:MAG: type II toxin-antitoxin system prevent-host-death family antitoxin [Chloroflexota bacterium]